jgi:primosomal protein N' (replication factor Y) (superfamily II helicase)
MSKLIAKDTHILRIDSDTREKTGTLYSQIGSSDIILTTQIGGSIVHPDIGAVIWLSFELNLSIPSYHIEEDIYSEISYYKKQDLSLYIQTYTPDHPLLREIIDGNTRSFLSYLSRERIDFAYPPFAELATIRVHDEQKKKVEDIMRKLINKIGIIKKESTFLAFDTDIRERYSGEWQQKIIIKDKDISYILRDLEVEIVRNRSVTLEWS